MITMLDHLTQFMNPSNVFSCVLVSIDPCSCLAMCTILYLGVRLDLFRWLLHSRSHVTMSKITFSSVFRGFRISFVFQILNQTKTDTIR